MGPKPPVAQSGELFRPPLIEQLNGRHPLVRLAAVIMRALMASIGSAPGFPANVVR